MYTTENLHEKIKALRLYRGYKTQNAAAGFLDISRNQFSGWENGKTPPGIQSLIKLANAFKVEVNYFCADGPPEAYDLTITPQKQNSNAPFIEVSPAKRYLSLMDQAIKTGERLLVNVYPLSGTTRSIQEFTNRVGGCIVIDGKRLQENLEKNTGKLYIVDNAESSPPEDLRSFLFSSIPPYAPLIAFTTKKIDIGFFDHECCIQGLGLDGLEKIINETFPLLKEIKKTDNNLWVKLLTAFSSESYNRMNKIEELFTLFEEKEINNLSAFNLLAFFNE